MKNFSILRTLFFAILFLGSCTKKDNSNPNNPNNPNTNSEYAGYDFYVAEKGCSIVDLFTKNFQSINGNDKSTAFNVIGNNLYTYGAKKYRNYPEDYYPYYSLNDNYSSVAYKNGVELYTDIGGYSSSVFGVQESGGNTYCLTGFSSQFGVVSASAYTTLRCIPKVWKNGVLLDSLKGPFNNSVYVNGAYISNKCFGVYPKDLIVKGNDVYVSGYCYNTTTSMVSIGYWKNSVYTELGTGNTAPRYKMLVSDAGNIYYYSSENMSGEHKSLFKNNIEILNGALDNVGFKDFGLLNEDVYLLGTYYENGNKLGIYKNGILEFNTSCNNDNNYKLYVVDGKVFICALSLYGEYNNTSVFEYKTSSKTLNKVNNTNSNYASNNSSCTLVLYDGFQVVKNSSQLPTTTVPTLTTTAITSIAATTATSGGNISNQGNSAVTARGVCWSTSSNPTTANSKTINGTGTGSFTSSLTGLIANTTYYIRAYATNNAGTAYGNELSYTARVNCGTVTDIDGNVYNTVTIGTQCWMVENLKTTKYKDGTAIPTNLSDATWASTTSGAFAIYDNNAANNTTYGKLYNWYAVNTGKLAPAGWHVPTESEWTTLISYLGGESVAGDKMKSTSSLWNPYTGITNTNSSGFSGLPGGIRLDDGTYDEVGISGFWWSSTVGSIVNAWLCGLFNDASSFNGVNDSKLYGNSVRCIKN